MGGRLSFRKGLSAEPGGDVISHSLLLPTRNDHRFGFQLAKYFLACDLIRFLAHAWSFSQTFSYTDTWCFILLEGTSCSVRLRVFTVLIKC